MITEAEAEDEDRLEAIRRWHIFNRDPSDDHWRNIDSLLHTVENVLHFAEKVSGEEGLAEVRAKLAAL